MKNINKIIEKILIVLFVILLLGIWSINIYNNKKFKTFYGIVLKRGANPTTRGGNAVMIETGWKSLFPTFFSNAYNTVQVGDSVSKESGDFNMKIFRKENNEWKLIYYGL